MNRTEIKELLCSATRQYRMQQSDEYVCAYDIETVLAILSQLDSNTCVECQLNKDVLMYGQAFRRVKPDGTVERIDPMTVYIQPPKEPGEQ